MADRASFEKQDRSARMVRILLLFQALPKGVTTADLAARLGVSRRTAQREIRALEEWIRLPLHQEGNCWVLPEGSWLKPIALSLQEAMGLLLGARLMMRHADKADAFTAAAYEKLAAIMPEPVRQPVVDAAFHLSTKPVSDVYSRVLATVTQAWAERRSLTIRYRRRKEAVTREVWPLLLEPLAPGHSCYLLAWDPGSGGLRVFKVERIEEARMLDSVFEPPSSLSLHDRLRDAWGVWCSEESVEVELLFLPAVADRVRESIWHPSQRLERMDDGRLRMQLSIGSWLEIRHWVLGWGEACEVLQPAALRESVAEAVRGLVRVYEVTEARVPSVLEGDLDPIAAARRRRKPRMQDAG